MQAVLAVQEIHLINNTSLLKGTEKDVVILLQVYMTESNNIYRSEV